MGANPKLTVSIVLYKTPIEDLKSCLQSLSRCGEDFHLFIVDNSPDSSLRSEFDGLIPCNYIHLPSNPGFGAGHNVAIRLAQNLQSKYHLVINADVSFDYDIVSPIIDFMERRPNVGHVMPKILNPDGSLQYLCKLVPTPMDLLFRRLLPRDLKESHNHKFELRASGYDKVMFVPYLSGCFMLLRQSALADVGLFDERFFMYPEDIDLTRRIAEKYETVYFPEVSAVHLHGAASRKSLKMFYIHFSNLCKYFNKWGWFSDSTRVELNRKTLRQF